MKAEHKLGQNHASMVLNAAFPPEASWSQPDALADSLWDEAEQKRLMEAIRSIATALPDVVVGQHRSFTAFPAGYSLQRSVRPSLAVSCSGWPWTRMSGQGLPLLGGKAGRNG